MSLDLLMLNRALEDERDRLRRDLPNIKRKLGSCLSAKPKLFYTQQYSRHSARLKEIEQLLTE